MTERCNLHHRWIYEKGTKHLIHKATSQCVADVNGTPKLVACNNDSDAQQWFFTK